MSGVELEPAALEALADRWTEAWAGRQGPGFAACCTPDVHYEDPVATEPLEGLDALIGYADRLRRAFPDLRVERAARPVASGGFACLPWRAAGTNRRALGSVPATRRPVTMHGVHYAELSDGALRRVRGFFDVYDAARQLGLAPARGTVGETALLVLQGFGLRARGGGGGPPARRPT